MSVTSEHELRRNMPFLHRNWVVGLNHAQGLGHYGSHPTKKRRLDEDADSPNGRDTYSPVSSLGLLEEPKDRVQALSIKAVKIVHKDTIRVKFGANSNDNNGPTKRIKIRCKMTIYEADPSHVIFCDSQVCEMTTLKNRAGPGQEMRVNLPHPFQIPKEKLLVQRPDDHVFTLADSYTVVIDIEGAGDANWPPHGLVRPNDADIFAHQPRSSHLLVLSTTFELSRGVSWVPICRKYRGWADEVEQTTDLVLETTVSYTTGFSDRAIRKRIEQWAQRSITYVEEGEDTPVVLNGRPPVSSMANGTNGVNGANALNGSAYMNGNVANGHHANGQLTNGDAHGHFNGDVMEDLDEEADGEITPSRSLRARGTSKTYNLKLLSDQAQGKERRRRRKLDSKYDKPGDDSRVVYCVPSESITLEGLTCCLCGARCDSASLLRAHFSCHPQYGFDFEHRQGKVGHLVTVSVNMDVPGISLRPRIYQLGRPTKLLDLDKYLDGDDSWVTSRYGSDNDVLQAHSLPIRTGQPRPRSRGGRAAERKPLVPHTKKPLFDPLSKRLLLPGTEVPPPVHDDDWLAQKHRDHLLDFVDVDAQEKEYMTQWDAFMFKQRLNSEAYLSRCFGAFVKKMAPWLIMSKSRMNEFGVHMDMLLARGSIDRQAVHEAMASITEARNKQKAGDAPAVAEAAPKSGNDGRKRKRSQGCAVCGKLVQGSSLLTCSNETCDKPIYHEDCARVNAKIPVGHYNWRCNPCAQAK